MRISYNWLKEFVDFNEPPAKVAEMLTFLGLETCVLESGACCWTNVVTAKVLDVQKHPNADKLRVCSVTDGASTYSVVCGAPNVAAGQIVPLALLGAELPGGLTIKKAKLRGVESTGMICSTEELNLNKDSDGIMVLPEATPVGKPLEEILKADSDTILEVEITTNRPDCLSHWGVARELAAKLRQPVRLPEIKTQETGNNLSITIKEPQLCTRYIGCTITGVTVAPSPEWLVKKLEKCGLRPINNIVDITNYVLMELGHPLHAFDADLMDGREIVVRKANPGEKIKALDGKDYTLTDSMLVIADRTNAQAIAGTIGGEKASVTNATKNIILESALFAPVSIRRTSRALNITTDSSYRFERGTAWEAAEMASWRAAGLILQLAGGKLEAGKDEADKIYVPAHIRIRPERVKHILDIELSRDEITAMLTALGLRMKVTDEYISASIPSWRPDLTQEIDLIEELARMAGYEKIPVTMLTVRPDLNQGKKLKSAESIVREKLSAAGFCEAVNYSFAEEKELNDFHLPVAHRIANPLSKENEVLRSSLLPGLWKNALLNAGQGNAAISLFETGTVFTPKGEKKALGVFVSGNALPAWWAWNNKGMPPAFDFYFLNGLLFDLLSGNRLSAEKNEDPSPFFHPGKAALLKMQGKTVGEFGMLRPEYAADLQAEAGYAELDLALLDRIWNRGTPQYTPLKRFPSVKRDLSILADSGISFDRIFETVSSSVDAGRALTMDFTLTDIYEDAAKLGPDKKSYTFHITFRPLDHTLTDREANDYIDKIVRGLKDTLNITLRA